jgi:hypothetical protein
MRYDILREAAQKCSEDPDFNMNFWATCLGGRILNEHAPEWDLRHWEQFLTILEEVLEVEDESESKALYHLVWDEQNTSREEIVPLVERYIQSLSALEP